MKRILLGILLFVLLSCNSNSNFMKNESLNITLNSILFENNKYTLKSDNWYYPYQMLYQFNIVNNSNNNIAIIFNSATKGGAVISSDLFIVLNQDTLFLGIKKKVLIGANDSAIFYAYLLNSPIFDSTYSSKEFMQYLNYIQNNSEYFIKLHYDTLSNHNYQYIRVFPDLNFKIVFNHWKDCEINSNNIGYPSDAIPDSIFPVKPISGIEY